MDPMMLAVLIFVLVTGLVGAVALMLKGLWQRRVSPNGWISWSAAAR